MNGKHRKTLVSVFADMAAERAGKSLDQWAEEALDRGAGQGSGTTPAPCRNRCTSPWNRVGEDLTAHPFDAASMGR